MENTIRSVNRALEMGAHGVEVDVRFADGELVVKDIARMMDMEVDGVFSDFPDRVVGFR